MLTNPIGTCKFAVYRLGLIRVEIAVKLRRKRLTMPFQLVYWKGCIRDAIRLF
jgi:hypothetical protein